MSIRGYGGLCSIGEINSMKCFCNTNKVPGLGEIFLLHIMVVLIPNRYCDSIDRVLILQCGGFTGLKLSCAANNLLCFYLECTQTAKYK